MRCPFCGFDDTQVKDSRATEDGSAIRRRRECPECSGRFTTFERIQMRELYVKKSSGASRLFDRDKLLRSITVAVRKRPIAEDAVEQMVNKIMRELSSLNENEIPTSAIGQKVMRELAALDEVAYIRYASVYSDFKGAKDFEKFIAKHASRIIREKKAKKPKK